MERLAHLRFEALVHFLFGPEVPVAVLHPLEIRSGDAGAVGEDVGDDEDAAVVFGLRFELHGLPTFFQREESVEAGGLISYGPSLTDQVRQAARYVDRIFKGAKPADLPVEQPDRIKLVVNVKTAKALGIQVPSELLVRADKVIQ